MNMTINYKLDIWLNRTSLLLLSTIIINVDVVTQVFYYVVDSPRNEGKDYFEINKETGEVFTKIVFDREKQGAYALEVEARDGAPSARPNNDNAPNSGINHDVQYSIVLFIKLC